MVKLVRARRRRQLAAFAFSLAAGMACACASGDSAPRRDVAKGADAMAAKSDDAKLVDAVKRAAAEQLAPAAVEARVGRKATSSRRRDAEGHRAQRGDLA